MDLYASGFTPRWPLFAYDHAVGHSILAGPVYAGTAYPAAYRGRLLYGDSVDGFIKAVDVENPSSGHLTLADDLAYPVDLQPTPEGEVAYVSFTQGAVRRIRYAPENKTPVAAASGSPVSGEVPLSVDFSAAGSNDPNGDPLSYRWDFGDGSAPAEGAEVTHRYERAGTFTARLTVADDSGAQATADVLVFPGNDPPQLRITAPADGSRFTVGGDVELRLEASDPQDGQVSPADIEWDVRLHHAQHAHPFITRRGASARLRTTTNHDADSYYEIRATATDSGGLSTSQAVDIRPRTTDLRIHSEPAGAEISYNGKPLRAPVSLTTAIGFQAPVGAGEALVAGGRRYRFAAWSNGGARVQTVTVPARPSELVARYEPVGGPAGGAWRCLEAASAGRPAAFRLDRPKRAVSILAGAAAGVASVQLAVRRPRTGAPCRWWSLSRGGLGPRRSCDRPVWMTARVSGTGAQRRWRLRLRGSLSVAATSSWPWVARPGAGRSGCGPIAGAGCRSRSAPLPAAAEEAAEAPAAHVGAVLGGSRRVVRQLARGLLVDRQRDAQLLDAGDLRGVDPEQAVAGAHDDAVEDVLLRIVDRALDRAELAVIG